MSKLLIFIMQKYKITGILVAVLCSFLYKCDQKPIDRSGFEIFSIISSEIKRFQYYDGTFLFDATRTSKNSKIFNIKKINKKTGIIVNCSQTGKKFMILLERFSTIRALKKIDIDSDASVHKLGGITIEDYSILEPAEFNFIAKDNSVILKLFKDESYIVDIPMSEFQKLKEILEEQIGQYYK
jgi:hypothetical protein